MKDSKPEWYARLQKGPMEQTVFDEKMQQKVQERVDGRGTENFNRRLNPWAALGVAAILTVCVIVFFPSITTRMPAPTTGGSASAVMTMEYFHEHLRIGMSEQEVDQLLGEPTDRGSVVRDLHNLIWKIRTTWQRGARSRFPVTITE